MDGWWEAVRQQGCVSKWSSPCQKSDAGGYYKWMQWSIFSSNGFSMFCLKPGVIDFHRFSFKIRRPTTGRFHPTSKLQTCWPTGAEPSAESGFALMCWWSPKVMSWDDLVPSAEVFFFHTRLMSYCRCFDNNLVEYIELGNFSNFATLQDILFSLICDSPWNHWTPTLFVTELRPGAISCPNTTWSWKEMVLHRSPNEKQILLTKSKSKHHKNQTKKNPSCEKKSPDFVIKILGHESIKA